MEKIIQKAIEGGYVWGTKSGWMLEVAYCCAVCDPLFWQALGKACGWRKKCSECLLGDSPKTCKSGWHRTELTWKIIALRFHEINLTEGWGKAVAYLESLIEVE